jgi:hypothetical protein
MLQTENMQSADIGSLTKAVCAVMAGFRGVEKSGKNSFHGYKYASDADILWMLKPLLAEHGLSVMLVGFEVIHTGEVKTNNGKTERLLDLCVTYRLAHTSGQWVLVQSPGSGQDPGDKAHYKAMTGALKYALRQTFAIPTGDDPEADGKDDNRGGGGQQQRRQDNRRQDDAPREERRQESKREEPKREERPAERPAQADAPKTPAEQVAWLLGELLKLSPAETPAAIAREWNTTPDKLVENIDKLKGRYRALKATSKAAESSKEAP